MLLQTNSYVVPKERRAEHQRLLRRFRQTLARLGCEHFEVYEQVGVNWTAGDNAGRFVQIMRFRDRRHQLSVQSAERADPGAQAVIAEFCNLINFPYQQQQGLFAVGFYQSALPVTMRREATRAEVAASDAAATVNEPQAEAPAEQTAEAQTAEEDDVSGPAADKTQGADADEEVELKAESDFDTDELAEEEEAPGVGEGPEDRATGEEAIAAEPLPASESDKVGAAVVVEERGEVLAAELEVAEPVEARETDAAVEARGTDSTDSAGSTDSTSSPRASSPQADSASSPQASSLQATSEVAPPADEAVLAAEQSADAVDTTEEDEASPDVTASVEEKRFGGEEAEPNIAEPTLAGPAEEAIGEAPTSMEAERELDEIEAEHAGTREQVADAGAIAGQPEWAPGAEPASELDEQLVEARGESEVMEEAWDEVEPAQAVDLSAEEGNIEIVYEQLPATADEVTQTEAGEPEAEEEGGFDALLSNEQLHEGFDAEDDLMHSAAHRAELHAHSAPGGRNGNSHPRQY